MANTRITDRGLLLYYTSQEEISKIDSTQLGELIKKELAWMSGRSEEPVFEDVRCDILHMHLKEQIVVRDIARDNHNPNGSKQSDTKEEPVAKVPEFGNPINITVTKEDLEDEPEPKKQTKYCGTFEDAVTRLKSSPRADWYRIANQYSSKCGYNVQELINAAS